MDILIRDIEAVYVKEIDRRCEVISKKLGKKYSRNEYIQTLVRNDSEKEFMQFKEDQFDEAIKNLSITLERQEKQLQEYADTNTQLISLLLEKMS